VVHTYVMLCYAHACYVMLCYAHACGAQHTECIVHTGWSESGGVGAR
jgi:hypothetical protein